MHLVSMPGPMALAYRSSTCGLAVTFVVIEIVDVLLNRSLAEKLRPNAFLAWTWLSAPVPFLIPIVILLAISRFRFSRKWPWLWQTG